MENLEQTKLRLLRAAIQENIEGARRIKANPSVRPKRIVPLWLGSFILIATLAYVFVPSHVVSTGTASSPETFEIKRTNLPSPVEDQAAERVIPLSAPRPLNRAVFPLSVKKIVIDPGHGGRQHGAISESGVSEKEITLDIALRLRRLLEKDSFEVVLTRGSDQTLSLVDRVALANANSGDILVSIHVNWMAPREVRALETYFVGPTDDPAVIKLAGTENRESGYSLSDYRQLLEKVYIHARRDESRRLAKTIHTELYETLGHINPALEDRGIKMAPFVILVGTQMPAILVEVSCLSNEDEVRLLTNADYRENIALPLYRGIRAYANRLGGSDRKGS